KIWIGKCPPRHARQSEYMLNHERQIEADGHQPKHPFTDSLGHHSAAHFRKPIVNPAQDREDDQADKNVMKVRNEVIAVLGLPVERRDRVTDAGESADKKRQTRCKAEKR